MSKLLKAVLVTAYGVLFVQYLNITLMGRSKDSIEIEYISRQPGSLKKIVKEIRRHGANMTLRKLTLTFKQPERLHTDLKYVLKWTEAIAHSFTHPSIFPNGQSVFIDNKCEFINCFMTNDKSLLPDRRNFDAILFDVENSWDNHPIIRSPHQYYIFCASESAFNFPICHSSFESHYNLTWTYKLSSDIRWSYMTILDKFDKVVGPKINMTWINPMEPTSETIINKVVHKKKVAAWFVSHCRTKSLREKVAKNLSAALAKYNLKIDIYGWCGDLVCPGDQIEECLSLLEKDYYFYLAFENSLSEDYVTDKVMYALSHFSVPVVYGGADYSRFLPPGSYLDAGKYNAAEIAFHMHQAITNHTTYQNYFRWHNHYKYKESSIVPDVCSLCRLLNNSTLEPRVITNFRQWWSADYKRECAAQKKRFQPD